MYTRINYRTKKALKADVVAGKDVEYFQPGPFEGNRITSGTIYLEGPHYPEPHRWYATAKVENGRIVSVK